MIDYLLSNSFGTGVSLKGSHFNLNTKQGCDFDLLAEPGIHGPSSREEKNTSQILNTEKNGNGVGMGRRGFNGRRSPDSCRT